MNLNNIARETAKTLQDYLTYQAVRQVVAQLSETNPPQAIWLRQFSDGSGRFQDSEAYLQALMVERKDLVLRILTVREYLIEQIADGLMDLVKTRIRESNQATRCQILERLTQTQTETDSTATEASASDAPSEVADADEGNSGNAPSDRDAAGDDD